MENEQNKSSQNPSSTGGYTPPETKTGQSSGAAVQTKRDTSPANPNETAVQKSSFGSKPEAAIQNSKSLLDQAKETAGQAYDSVSEKAATKLDEQKSSLSGGLASVADSVRKVGQNLKGGEATDTVSKYTAEYSDAAAQKIEQVANYFERKDVKAMYRDVENFARSNPAIFVGGAFALGLIAARFLKSSSPKQLTKAAGQSFNSANSGYGETKPSTNQSSY